MAKRAQKIRVTAPKGRNPVAATLRDPSAGFNQRSIPDKRRKPLDRKRKHKGDSYE